jgi:hypothetical protein
MRAPTTRHDLITRFSHGIHLPEQQGWAVRWLSLWFLGNLVWILGGLVTSIYPPEFQPPPGWTYWSLWCGGGSVVVVVLSLILDGLVSRQRSGLEV